MKTKMHALAGVIGFLTIVVFWSSTAISELFLSHEAVATVKGYILQGLFILIPAMIIVGASGRHLASGRSDVLITKKMKRMPIIAMTGIFVMVPAAFFLESKASAGAFDIWFYIVQVIELIGGASNLRLMMLNIKDGLRITGKIADTSTQGEAAANPTIKAQENGPLIVQGTCCIINADGDTTDAQNVTALCRCGASKNKPYCDGSHNGIEFADEILHQSADATIDYKGKEITIHYNKVLCSHAAECGTRLKPVFDSTREPWIVPDNGSVEAIKKVILACPSGALSYSEHNTEAAHITSSGCGIYVEKNGPFHVKGIPLMHITPSKYACPDKYVLCRCGASKNKPFCDGSHVDIGWKDN